MNKQTPMPVDNVVHLPVKPRGGDGAGEVTSAQPTGSHNDPRTQEALRLVGSFLAIEDASARAALIALAESLVSHDWLRWMQPRTFDIYPRGDRAVGTAIVGLRKSRSPMSR